MRATREISRIDKSVRYTVAARAQGDDGATCVAYRDTAKHGYVAKVSPSGAIEWEAAFDGVLSVGFDRSRAMHVVTEVDDAFTLIIPDLAAAADPAVADIIRHAEAVFIAGGNQARYVEFWKGTPVQDAINANVASGKPIGGTSAGLAVLGEFAYGCLKDKDDDKDLASTDVLPNPYHERVTLVRDFLKIPNLENTLTDSHFAKRDRIGRTLGFLSRLVQDGWSKATSGTPTTSSACRPSRTIASGSKPRRSSAATPSV